MIRGILHYCKRFAVLTGKAFSSLVPKDKQLILFSAWFGEKYIDSSRYQFEYCLNNKLFKPVWYTRNKVLYHSLKESGIPVVYSKSLRSLILQLRAIMFVSSVQLADFPPYFLGKCIYFDLGHGFPIKESGYEQPDTTQKQIEFDTLVQKMIRYYMCSSSTWVNEITTRSFHLKPEQDVFCNKPRTDVLFDEKMRAGKNQIVEQLKNGKKAIVYMPTQRSLGKVPIQIDKILDLPKVQSICEEHSCVFLIKKHFYHRNEVEHLERFPNIFDITNEDIDPEVLTYQADALISDYSAAYIDYLLLDRPIIFYAFDFESYLRHERNMYLKFEDIHAGYKPQTPEALNDALQTICSDWKDDTHKSGRMEIRRQYFDDDVSVGNTRETISVIMQQLIDNTYQPKWGIEQ